MKSLSLMAVAAASVSASEVTPVEKVIAMVEELQVKVMTEGKAEAATYNTFACFCKDSSIKKNKSIEDLTLEIDGLNADLTEQTKNRAEADTEMRNQQDEMNKLAEEKAKIEADGRK